MTENLRSSKEREQSLFCDGDLSRRKFYTSSPCPRRGTSSMDTTHRPVTRFHTTQKYIPLHKHHFVSMCGAKPKQKISKIRERSCKKRKKKLNKQTERDSRIPVSFFRLLLCRLPAQTIQRPTYLGTDSKRLTPAAG